MATDFLIALAIALGSATLILLVLFVFLKAVAPNAFKERIFVSGRVAERHATETARVHLVPKEILIRDGAPAAALLASPPAPSSYRGQLLRETAYEQKSEAQEYSKALAGSGQGGGYGTGSYSPS